MNGAAIFDSVSAGLPEALEAVELCRARLADLPDGDFRALLEELTARDPLTAADAEVLALCLTEATRRFLRTADSE